MLAAVGIPPFQRWMSETAVPTLYVRDCRSNAGYPRPLFQRWMYAAFLADFGVYCCCNALCRLPYCGCDALVPQLWRVRSAAVIRSFRECGTVAFEALLGADWGRIALLWQWLSCARPRRVARRKAVPPALRLVLKFRNLRQSYCVCGLLPAD